MRRLVTLALICGSMHGCVNKPNFVTTPSRAYPEFEALAVPRTDVAVGAFWIEKYGISGAGAHADNLETIKGLSGITFDSAFQLSLTAGLLQFLDLDPSIRRHVAARFTDVSIVRVKDISKLPFPDQPHVYAALKAATITITADGSTGLDIENRAISQHLPIFSRGTTGLARTFTIDGRDLYFAVHVAKLKQSRSRQTTVELRQGSHAKISLGPASLQLSYSDMPRDLSVCTDVQYVLTEGGYLSAPTKAVQVAVAAPEPTLIALALPQGDQQGGLLTHIELRAVPLAKAGARRKCDPLRIAAALIGTRLETVSPH